MTTTTTTHLLGILPTPEPVLGVTLKWTGTDRMAAWNLPADEAHTWAEQLNAANKRAGTVAEVKVYPEALHPMALEAMNATL